MRLRRKARNLPRPAQKKQSDHHHDDDDQNRVCGFLLLAGRQPMARSERRYCLTGHLSRKYMSLPGTNATGNTTLRANDRHPLQFYVACPTLLLNHFVASIFDARKAHAKQTPHAESNCKSCALRA
jgi:hypothetical protein